MSKLTRYKVKFMRQDEMVLYAETPNEARDLAKKRAGGITMVQSVTELDPDEANK